ncbi:MAG: sensor histidine kinase [Oligoflexales bacterium]
MLDNSFACTWVLNSSLLNLDEISEKVQVGFWHFKNGHFDYQIDNPKKQNILEIFNQMASFVSRYIGYKKYKTQLDLSAKLAHDTKAPLVSIKLALTRISQAPEAEKIEKFNNFMPFILKSAEDSLKLIDAILKSDDMLAPANARQIPLDDFIENFADNLAACYQFKNIETKIDPSIRLYIADEIVLKRIFGNLLKNIFENVSREEKVSIVGIIEDEFAYITVKNTGIGIPSELQKNLFFRKESLSSTNGYGLPSCYDLIKQLGGDLWCDSSVNQSYTNFCFTLPINSSEGEVSQ